jgi:hypothetical protein
VVVIGLRQCLVLQEERYYGRQERIQILAMAWCRFDALVVPLEYG